MRTCLITGIVSPHQMPLARQLAALVGEANFRYVSTEPLDAARRTLGWEERDKPAWVLEASAGGRAAEDGSRWAREAEVVLCGNRDLDLFRNRLANRRLTFYMAERWFKPPWGRLRVLSPSFARMLLGFRQAAQDRHLHYLAIGRYAAGDMRRVAAFHKRVWLWGYFVDVAAEMPEPPAARDGLRLLWAGRMLGLKRVDLLVAAVHRLRREGRECRLHLVGYGECLPALQRQVLRLGLEPYVTFQPPVPIAEMRAIMRQANVYVLPSNGKEGWGAVVNEAMSEGVCAVVSDSTGAGATLIQHGENGLLFRCGDGGALCDCLRRLHDDPAERLRIARAGYQSLRGAWTPQVAADRWLRASDRLLSGQPVEPPASGPMQALWDEAPA
jgi:glycosyltransferase involved in cell wall biosynthesis